MENTRKAYISISALSKEHKISRDILVRFFVEKGYIKDIRHVTDKGRLVGIFQMEGEKDGRKYTYLGYSENVQKYIAGNRERLIKKYEGRKEGETAPAATSTSTPVSAPKAAPVQTPAAQPSKAKVSRIKTLCHEWKYTGLPKDFVVIDTETTGFGEDDEVVELSVVSKEGVELYHSYFLPEKEVNPFAAKVNGLSREGLKAYGAPMFVDEWAKIVRAVNGRPVLGHNIPFDKRLVAQTLAKQGSEACADEAFPELFDSKAIAKALMDAPSYSLNNLTTMVGITREEQHDSTDDCRMTLEFVERLEDIVRIQKEYGFIR